MRFKHTHLILFSGLVWLAIGIFLLTKGLHLIIDAAHIAPSNLLLKMAALFGGAEPAALILIAFGLLIGFVKGRTVLLKSAKRVAARIVSMPSPVKFSQVYSWGYYALIGSMVCLGISMRWLPINSEIRGFIDVAIGSALINGAMAYYRLAMNLKKESSHS